MNTLRIFGLTGGVACGKSTVGRFFEGLGARVIDADKLGHELMQPGLPAYEEVVAYFGSEILAENGEIDRRLLGHMVFTQPAKLPVLNAILHPKIRARALELAQRAQRQNPLQVILEDAALLYEAGLSGDFVRIVVAWCRPELQLARVLARPGITLEDARRRIGSQMPADEKKRRADFVVDTSGPLQETRQQVAVVYAELQKVVHLEA
jgi:dephospho-CoA kinase